MSQQCGDAGPISSLKAGKMKGSVAEASDALLCAFDLIELDGEDLRSAPIE